MEDCILFEQPLTERIRTFLRLESLFNQAKFTLQGDSFWHSRYTLHTLIEILNVFERGDLKSEVLKELERHTTNLTRLRETPNVDTSKLNIILAKLQAHTDKLQQMLGRIGYKLKEVELINTVRQRLTIPGGTCNFDVPTYHFWLEQPIEYRNQCLRNWLNEFSMVDDSISLLLELIRNTAMIQDATAEQGFYQQTLEANNPCQLVRVLVAKQDQVLAEISGGKHRISIRFLESPNMANRAVQTTQTIPFQLACCV